MNEINPIIIELLMRRGISEENEVLEFLSDKPQKTYDPFLLLHLEAGVDLLLSAIRQNKKICVYGDYDADGITSIRLMTQILSHLTDQLCHYVPSRFEEGYGLNKAAVEAIHRGGAGMIVTVDCGSVSWQEAALARGLGMDVLITDHHSVDGAIADCLVINPKQPGCAYPFKDLAGVGVAFKLAQGIQKKAGLPKNILNRVLDLVAIGTIGDIVPLVDENRTLAKYGLHELNRLERKGLRQLAGAVCQKNSPITAEHVAFMIVPHLNAAGRMGSAEAAVDLLTSEEDGKIHASVGKLMDSNHLRKQAQEEAYQSCVEIIEAGKAENQFLLISLPGAHEGIAGIVAGKLKDKYHKPAIIVTESDGFLKGAGRSTEKIHLHRLLRNFEEIFIKFGGHAGACGFLMRPEDLAGLELGLEDRMKRIIELDPSVLDSARGADLTLRGGDLTMELVEALECLAPFGNQNRRPLIRIEGIRVKDPAPMGESGKHARFTALCGDGAGIPCVLFNKAEEYVAILRGAGQIAMIGSVEARVWNGNKRIQFLVEGLLS